MRLELECFGVQGFESVEGEEEERGPEYGSTSSMRFRLKDFQRVSNG